MTMKRTFTFLITLALFVIHFNVYAKTQNTIDIKLKNIVFTLEKADTPFTRRQGLMHRKTLQNNRGMIFIYDYPQKTTFWMGHTLIPLDLIMINKDKKVCDIYSMYPQKPKQKNETDSEYKNRLKKYTSSEKILYAIEVNIDTCKHLGIKKGDTIDIP